MLTIGGTLIADKLLYSNVYTDESSLPNAGTYHGMFAHVHGTGRGYFSHAGAWHKLIDETSAAAMADTLTLNKGTGAGLVVTADAHIGGKIGINNTSPSVSLDIEGTDAIRIASGSTAERPTVPQLGQIRYNTTLDQYEGYVECSDGVSAAWAR